MDQESVFLLHALALNARSLSPLANALSQAGYETFNLDYPSRQENLADLAQEIYHQLQPLLNQNRLCHFVSHSMGSLVLRELLSQYTLPKLGRIIMIAPPNHGSEVADFFHHWFFYKKFFGPAAQQLTTRAAKNYPNEEINYELGIIAGNCCLDPFCAFLLKKPHDGKVTVESTKMKGMKDHIVLPAIHALIMRNKKTIYQVIHFLKNGKFDHTALAR